MLENPFLTPPQVEGPQSRSWGRGFVFGFQNPPADVSTPVDVEDSDAFQQGAAAGQVATENGLDIISDACVDLNAEHPADVELAATGFDAIEFGSEVIHKAFSGAIFSAVLLFVDVAIGMQTHFDDPGEALQSAANALQQLLNNLGINDSMELFVGGGIDTDIAQCELKLTAIFRSESAAQSAAQALRRPKFLVVGWRTDQSGGMTLHGNNF